MERHPSLRLTVLGLTLAFVACSSPVGPTPLFGTYRMISYTRGAGDPPLPYMQQSSASPADTDETYGRTLTLESDDPMHDQLSCASEGRRKGE